MTDSDVARRGYRRAPRQSGPDRRGDCRQLGMGGKDLYRQARAIWRLARSGDVRAQSGIAQLDAGTKTIHAAYKDLRRRDRFQCRFSPDTLRCLVVPARPGLWHPPPGCDPAGDRRTCSSLLHAPQRPRRRPHGRRRDHARRLPVDGTPLLRLRPSPDPPGYPSPRHTPWLSPRGGRLRPDLLRPPLSHHAGPAVPPATASPPPRSPSGSPSSINLARHAFATLRPGGCLALLLAAQTEKDLPAGFGYLDHAFLGYIAALRAGFLPERRISCPMDGAYLPQHVRRARSEGRLLGQVRDLLVMRKPSHSRDNPLRMFCSCRTQPIADQQEREAQST